MCHSISRRYGRCQYSKLVLSNTVFTDTSFKSRGRGAVSLTHTLVVAETRSEGRKTDCYHTRLLCDLESEELTHRPMWDEKKKTLKRGRRGEGESNRFDTVDPEGLTTVSSRMERFAG